MKKMLENKFKDFNSKIQNPKVRQEFERFYKTETKKQVETVKEVIVVIKTIDGKEKVVDSVKEGDSFKISLVDISFLDLLFLLRPLIEQLIEKAIEQEPVLKPLHILLKKGRVQA